MPPRSLYAESMQVAWEQVGFWSTYMSAKEAALLCQTHTVSWEGVARKLARMWLELAQPVDEVALTHARAA